MPTWSGIPRFVGRAAPTESRARSAPAVDSDIDIDLFSETSRNLGDNSLSHWYDRDDNADGSAHDESIWLCVSCGCDRFVWNAPTGIGDTTGFWSCAACSSLEFFDSTQPARQQTQHGTWVFMPNGGAGSQSEPSPSQSPSQVTTGRHRRRHRGRRRHGPPPSEPEEDGDEGWEAAESERLTHDPSVNVTPAGSVVQPQQHVPQQPGGRQRAGVRAGQQQQPANQIEALAAAIQRLADKKKSSTSTDSWVSAMGPQKGVRFRGGAPPQPPSWSYNSSDLRAYEKFERKVKIWELHAKHFMTEAEVALTLFTSLKGEAEQELEFVDISTIYKRGGVDQILSLLRQAFQQKTVYIKRQYLHDYEAIGRWPNESLRSYINRYRRVEQSLLAVGVNVGLTYDDESRGSRLLDRARLSQEQQRLILVGSAQSLSFDAIRAALMLQYPEHKPAPPVTGRESTTAPWQKGSGKYAGTSSSTSTSSPAANGKGKGKDKGPRRVFATETQPATIPEGDEDEPPDDLPDDDAEDPPPDNDEEEEPPADGDPAPDGDNIDELTQVLTVTARKLANMTLGRKFSNQPKRSIQDKKKSSICAACGLKGHWANDPECELSGNVDGKATTSSSSSTTPSKGKGKGQKGRDEASTAKRVLTVHHSSGFDNTIEIFANTYQLEMAVNDEFIPTHDHHRIPKLKHFNDNSNKHHCTNHLPHNVQ
eukprot:Skav201113  [mRNA]  locus=scaffold185:343335:349401:+ [translate_table: standard]